MLSDEEKKAIEDLKDMIEKSKDLMEEEFYKLATIHNIQAVATVLNLIEKQSKEIEILNKENTRQHELIGNIHKKWEDKIKAKIEEIDKAYEDSKNEDGESEYYYPSYTVEVLQSLLDKE